MLAALLMLLSLHAAAAGAAAAAAPAASAQQPQQQCATMADVLTRELGMGLSPVFQRIYGNPKLRGLLLLPTRAAWDALVTETAAAQGIDLNSSGGGDASGSGGGGGKGQAAAPPPPPALAGGALALYWLSRGSDFEPRALDTEAVVIETEVGWHDAA